MLLLIRIILVNWTLADISTKWSSVCISSKTMHINNKLFIIRELFKDTLLANYNCYFSLLTLIPLHTSFHFISLSSFFYSMFLCLPTVSLCVCHNLDIKRRVSVSLTTLPSFSRLSACIAVWWSALGMTMSEILAFYISCFFFCCAICGVIKIFVFIFFGLLHSH